MVCTPRFAQHHKKVKNIKFYDIFGGCNPKLGSKTFGFCPPRAMVWVANPCPPTWWTQMSMGFQGLCIWVIGCMG